MLLKWITLQVPPRHRVAFSAAQDRWQALAAVPGFRWQVAGWTGDDPARFGALSFWDGAVAYRAFMAGPHDGLAAAQTGLYADTEVRLVECLSEIDTPCGADLRLDPEAPGFGLGVGPVELHLHPGWRVTRREK